jgi:hypothetical protein
VEHKVVAVGWYCKLIKTIISTCGNCLEGVAQVVPRSRRIEINGLWETENYFKSTRRVNIVQNMFRHFSTIDIHDHYRQGTLALEYHWKTRNWWHRLFSTLLGIIFTDAYFMYRKDYLDYNNVEQDILSFEEFLGILAYEMIHNTIDEAANSRNLRKRSQTDIDQAVTHWKHTANPLSSHPSFNERKMNSPQAKYYRFRTRCTICDKITSHYCTLCSDNNHIVGICNPQKANDGAGACQEMHEQDMRLNNKENKPTQRQTI